MDKPELLAALSASGAEVQLEQLRKILLGQEMQAMQAFARNWQDEKQQQEQLSKIISEAIALRSARDTSLAQVLSPTLEAVLERSIEQYPHKMANAIYPVMGPAIRKSINETLSQILENLNQLLEQSLSARILLWRFDAWRSGRSYSEVVLMKTLLYQVEQVFLIHRETGLLLQHVLSPKAISCDPDMVSGMLTAIQDFVRDSFSVKEGEGLNSLRLGELTVLIEQGSRAVLAAVVRGNPPAGVRTHLIATLEAIQGHLRMELKHFSGDSSPFERARFLLEECLIEQRQKRKRNPWFAYLFLMLTGGGLAYWGITHYWQHCQWQSVLKVLKAEPGLVITKVGKQSGIYQIEGLRDPLARSPERVVASLAEAKPLTMSFAMRPYLSMDEAMVLQRAQHFLQVPDSVKLNLLPDGLLQVSGQAQLAWVQALDERWPLVAGLKAMDRQALQVQDDSAKQAKQKQQQINAIIKTIENTSFSFEKGSNQPHNAEEHAQHLKQKLDELRSLVGENGQAVQVTIQGMADELGSKVLNRRLVKERAELMRDYLVQQGVPAAILFAASDGPIDSPERGVRYDVSLY